ncbi:tRNA pseudouridine(38-40) synthase [Tamilnaduibacter salinus]|uniref:tRNA pseudouridine synthase A n=1 Tax=Tamilnaduibacter salinus TaxID=1484056 RepID=A0A2U1CZN5_9GAMM|nr:tRNA pseudouridine(38-40) synthase TruA [Tamilnaduibacter salinus]PVY78242.1 tRNA pseudouridine(38-40) synthase [Tamilnaduibacter salinus]
MSFPEPPSEALSVGPGRVALIVEYDGAAYHGWQMQQPGVPSVEAEVRAAASRVANEPVIPVCAGRTDAGVHACAQVVHFDTQARRSQRSWVMGINTNLPSSVSVRWAGPVSQDFHARHSATARRYRYVIYSHPVRPALLRHQVAWTFRPMDAAAMNDAAQVLVGEHDFSTFRAAGCQSRTPFRNIHAIAVRRSGPFVELDVTANAFVHHMVRNLAGSLMAVGSGHRQPDWIHEILEARDRRQGGMTAPAQGLHMVEVTYPPGFGLPDLPVGPAFLSPVDRLC